MEQLQQGFTLVRFQQHDAGKGNSGGTSVKEWFPTSTEALQTMEVRSCPGVQAARHSFTLPPLLEGCSSAAYRWLPYAIPNPEQAALWLHI